MMWSGTSTFIELGNRATTFLPFGIIYCNIVALTISFPLAAVVSLGYTFPLLPTLTRTFRRTCICIFGLTSCIVFLSLTLPPYSRDYPQKLFVHPVFDESTPTPESFYWLLPTDFNRLQVLENTGALKLNQWKPDTIHANESLYGRGLSYPLPVAHVYNHGMVAALNATLISSASNRFDKHVDGNGLHVHASLGDASQLVVVIPDTITSWSLPHDIPPPHQFCKCHWIVFSDGGKQKVFDLDLRGEVKRVEMHALYLDAGIQQNWTKVPQGFPMEVPDWATMNLFPQTHIMRPYNSK